MSLNRHRRAWPIKSAASRISIVPGAGQVTVAGHHAYVGHIPNKDQLGTTIIDIADPYNPRVVATITLDDPASHSHKVRVVGDLMIVNHERNMTPIGRRAEQLPAARTALTAEARARADRGGNRRQDERHRSRSAPRSRHSSSAATTTAASRSTTWPIPRSRS